MRQVHLFKVKYLGCSGIAEIPAISKEHAIEKMERLSSAGCPPTSKFSYIGIQEHEPEPFYFPDFSPINPSGGYKKRKREAKELKKK